MAAQSGKRGGHVTGILWNSVRFKAIAASKPDMSSYYWICLPGCRPLPKRRHGKTSSMRSIIEWVLVAPTDRQVTSTKRRPLIFLIVSLKDEFNRFFKVRRYFRGEICRYFNKMSAVNADDQVTLLTPPVKVIWADAT